MTTRVYVIIAGKGVGPGEKKKKKNLSDPREPSIARELGA